MLYTIVTSDELDNMSIHISHLSDQLTPLPGEQLEQGKHVVRALKVTARVHVMSSNG